VASKRTVKCLEGEFSKVRASNIGNPNAIPREGAMKILTNYRVFVPSYL
jgi:hypothetical protein